MSSPICNATSQHRVLAHGRCAPCTGPLRLSGVRRPGAAPWQATPTSPQAWPTPRLGPCSTLRLPHRPHQPKPWPPSRNLTVTQAAATGILPLGFDLLTFLGSTVLVVPLFKRLKISPVLGFLLTGVVLHQLGLIRDPKDMEEISELGVLFLLFEMGLELSLDRLKALAKYAFGLGTLQMLICTAVFTAFALPAGQGLGTRVLEVIAHAPTSLVSIRSVDEAVVIGGALSMSSSAFVLQLLTERGEMPTKVGSATLGILLFQDIAVVPFLVLLPLAVQLQSNGMMGADAGAAVAAAAANPAGLVALLLPTALKTCAGLGLLLVGGRLLLRRVFELVAQSDNSETFVALCLLTVAGAALLTESLGFSDTMGAFTAGVLLSESSYKTQVEADIRPFRGLLLGLFFVTTGGSIDMMVLKNNWQVISWILVGLISIKTAVVAAVGPNFGLTRSESIRTGFMLSQGGEFAFVLLSLASSLHVLPEELNQVLIIVVVLSMALTPGLAELGTKAGAWVDDTFAPANTPDAAALSKSAKVPDQAAAGHHQNTEPVVICGFGPHAQMLVSLLGQPLASLPDPSTRSYIAFDLDPTRVQVAREAGYNVVYGDGSRAAVLRAAGVEKPKAIAVCLASNKVAAHRAVASLRASFPQTPIYALGSDIREAAELEEAGADRCVMSSTSVGISLGTEILARLGASSSEADKVGKEMAEAMATKTRSLADQLGRYGSSALDEVDITLMTRTTYTYASSGFDEEEEPTTPLAPAETLPSMADAMPAFLDVSRARASASFDGGDEAGEVVVVAGGSGDAQQAVAAKPVLQNVITGTATAQLDCGSDEECASLEVAEMLYVDADKQQQAVLDAAARVRAAAAAYEREVAAGRSSMDEGAGGELRPENGQGNGNGTSGSQDVSTDVLEVVESVRRSS